MDFFLFLSSCPKCSPCLLSIDVLDPWKRSYKIFSSGYGSESHHITWGKSNIFVSQVFQFVKRGFLPSLTIHTHQTVLRIKVR